MENENLITWKDKAISWGYIGAGIGMAGASAFVFGTPISLGIASAIVVANYWGLNKACEAATANVQFLEASSSGNIEIMSEELSRKAGLKAPPRVFKKDSFDMCFFDVQNMAVLPKTRTIPEGLLIVDKDFAAKFSEKEQQSIIGHETTHLADHGWFDKKFAFANITKFGAYVAGTTAVVGAVALGAPIIVGAMTSLGVVAAAQTAAVTLLAAHPSFAALSVVSSIGAKAITMVAGLGLGATVNPATVVSALAASVGLKTVAEFGGASLSRHKEYIADRGATILTGNVGAEIDSFNKMKDMILDEKLDNLDMTEYYRPKSNLEYLREAAKDVKSGLLASHPYLSKRIQRLERIKPNSGPK
jgi:hypothetical protein